MMMTQLEMFTPDIGRLWQQAGYIGCFETVIFGIPFVIWGAGAAEGIVRTTIECSKVIFKKALRQPAEENVEKLKKEYLITKGCLVLTGMSCIPLIIKTVPYVRPIFTLPAYYITGKTFYEISEQTSNYNRFKYAVEQAERHIITEEATGLADRVCELNNDEELDALTATLLQQLQKGVTVTQDDLDNNARQLQWTLIYRNWSYTAAYFTIEKTYTTTVNAANAAVQLAKHIFKSGLVKRALKFTVIETVKECQDVFSIPQMPARPGVG